jgi:hypothetical protein
MEITRQFQQPIKQRRMGCCPSAKLSILRTGLLTGENPGVNHFIVVVDVWQVLSFWSPGIISPGFSPVVLRLHIFDIEPPSVADSATNNSVLRLVRGYIKISLQVSYARINKRMPSLTASFLKKTRLQPSQERYN